MPRKPRTFKPVSPDIIIRGSNPSEPMEQKIGQDEHARIMQTTGDARDSLSGTIIEPVERPLGAVDQEKLAMMKFMNDNVTVHVHSTSDKQAEQIFELFINGERQVFRRNEKKTVPRRFVDLLARLKPTTYTQREITDANGDKSIAFDPHTGLRYPFSVVDDPHPRGGEWLRSVLAEA